jgi:hypothetical protein
MIREFLRLDRPQDGATSSRADSLFVPQFRSAFQLMPPLVLPQLGAGAPVSAELLVLDRVERTTGNGDPFWVLTLGNSSGALQTAPVWKDNASWVDGVD